MEFSKIPLTARNSSLQADVLSHGQGKTEINSSDYDAKQCLETKFQQISDCPTVLYLIKSGCQSEHFKQIQLSWCDAGYVVLLAIITAQMMVMQFQPYFCRSFESQAVCRLHWVWETEGGQGWGSPSTEPSSAEVTNDWNQCSGCIGIHSTVQIKTCPHAQQEKCE